jgi:hypothetical protein
MPRPIAVIPAYLWNHRIVVAVVLYIHLACFLKVSTSLDICIPCLWKTLFGIPCPGCGLTSAYIHLLEFDWGGAFRANPLVFIVVPAGVFYGIRDFRGFLSRWRNAAEWRSV